MAAVSPALKDLPKVSDDLKTQLEAFNHEQMKHANTKEKFILPSAEGKKMFSSLNTELPDIFHKYAFFYVVYVFVNEHNIDNLVGNHRHRTIERNVEHVWDTMDKKEVRRDLNTWWKKGSTAWCARDFSQWFVCVSRWGVEMLKLDNIKTKNRKCF